MFDQVPCSKISIIDKADALAFDFVAEHVEWAMNNETLIPEDFSASLKL